jgi:phosphatidylglycerophosphatase A
VWATGRLVTASDPDPKLAVWDEFVGMWATCLLSPKTVPWMAAAFLCFRILDVVKPWPVRRLERLPGGWGIMSDDLLAGLYGAVLLNGLRAAFFD